MANVTIDGITAEVPDGINLIKAAELLGIHIPHFCYHEKLSLVGQCRLCLVEIDPIPKLQTACSSFVKDGMVVRTDTDKCRKSRAAIMEFLLLNHPVDCPECDQAGECKLQDYSFLCGTCDSRLEDGKRTYPRDKTFGEKIVRIMDRCIHCTRCIRFMREIVEDELICFEHRGNNTAVTPVEGSSLDTMYSGNLAEVCPVGALTTREFRFKTRPWNMRSFASVCPLCSNGCNVYLDVKDDKIYRVKPRINDDVNGWWICDEGRFEYGYVNSPQRLTAPKVGARETSWEEAISAAAAGITSVAKEYGPEAVAGVCSASLTNEELHIFGKIMNELVGTKNIDCRLNDANIDPSEREDKLLRRLDKNANTRGAIALLCAPDSNGMKLAEKIHKGDIKALVLIGPGGKALASDLEKLVSAAAKAQCLVVIDNTESALSRGASVVLPGATYAEKNGTFTNHAGKVQRITAAIKSPGAAKPELQILLSLAAALGAKWEYKNDIDVYKEIKERLLKIEGEIKG